jgi:hypothetical protein
MILKNVSLLLDNVKTAFSKGEVRGTADSALAPKKLKHE